MFSKLNSTLKGGLANLSSIHLTPFIFLGGAYSTMVSTYKKGEEDFHKRELNQLYYLFITTTKHLEEDGGP